MIILTDSHTHILPTDVPNYQEILENLKQNNIKRIIINGYNDKTNKEVLELVSKYENVYGALGFHPDNINELTEDSLEFIKKNLNNPKIIAIGEIGLDYYHNKENKEDQIKLLEKFLELSTKTNKPVIIHNREATGDLINTLKKYKTKGIIHCFNGSKETANIFLKLGYKLGIGGVITFKNCKLKEEIKDLSPDSFFLETDAPYLTPEPYRGKRNEPKYMIYTLRALSSTLNINEEELSNTLENNFHELFDIKE
ncbi:MAG: TatD family hydrolase [Bacilli bacterium]|nr:TatD family hydrolase [Bacilli bacterium]